MLRENKYNESVHILYKYYFIFFISIFLFKIRFLKANISLFNIVYKFTVIINLGKMFNFLINYNEEYLEFVLILIMKM